MDKKLSILNLFLIFTAGTLIIMIIRIWAAPSNLSRVEDSSLSNSKKSFQKFSTKRKTYPASIVSQITGKNLFRKERVEFKEAKSPVVVAAASTVSLPPPNITVKGIILLRGTRIAVLEGSYSVQVNATTVEKKDIKKKGYRVGDYVGNYQITKIDHATVTLKSKSGDILTLKLKQKASSTPIKWDGASLFYKPPKPSDKPAPASDAEPAPVLATPAATPVTPAVAPAKPVPRISGRPQPVAQPQASISGARTAPQQTRPRISGR